MTRDTQEIAQAEAVIGKPCDFWRRYAFAPLDPLTDMLMTPSQMQKADAERVAEGKEPKYRNIEQRMEAARVLATAGRALLKQRDLDTGREYLIKRAVK